MENRLPNRVASSHRPNKIPHAELEKFLDHIESDDGVAHLERVDQHWERRDLIMLVKMLTQEDKELRTNMFSILTRTLQFRSIVGGWEIFFLAKALKRILIGVE
jgi:hypothetical protein